MISILFIYALIFIISLLFSLLLSHCTFSDLNWKPSLLIFNFSSFFKHVSGPRTSLMIQWLGIHLPKQRKWIQFLVQEDFVRQLSPCAPVIEPVCYNYWSPHALEPVVCNERPLQWKTCILQLESKLYSPQLEKACVQ